MVAERHRSEPHDGEARIELEPRADLFTRVLLPAKARQRGGEGEMGYRAIRIEPNRPIVPNDGFLVAASAQLAAAAMIIQLPA